METDTFGSLAHLGFPEPEVEVTPTPEGGWLLRSPMPMPPHPPTLIHALSAHARRTHGRVALSEQVSRGGVRQLNFDELWRTVSGLSRLLKPVCNEKPLMILSGNSIDHALVRLAAMTAGCSAAPVSPAYSLLPEGAEKLRHVYDLCRPGAVFVQDTGPFARALESLPGLPAVIAMEDEAGIADLRLQDWLASVGSGRDPDAFEDFPNPGQPAQIMFTSGSTGLPKGVVHTHGNLVSSLAQSGLVLTDTEEYEGATDDAATNAVSWLPWHHVSGTNMLTLGLFRGFSFFLDSGRPLPGQMEPTVEILRRVSQRFYVNVPAGYEMLIGELEKDHDFAGRFFEGLQFLIFGAAGITAETFRRYDRLARASKGEKVPFISAYGSTETTGSVTFTYFDADATGLMGLPVPGVAIKLVPARGKYEVRVKGPNVTPGYLGGSPNPFDEEGYLKTGDLADWVDREDFNKGLRFAGRVAEEFKLRSGTWVAGGVLRSRLIDLLAPLAKDAVVCGLNRAFVGALVWLDEMACRERDAGFDSMHPWSSAVVTEEIVRKLAGYNRGQPGSSRRIGRILLMDRPLSPACGEVSDKGSVNSALVQETRAADIERMYTSEEPGILVL
jgi:feruloyl-CoA synthase